MPTGRMLKPPPRPRLAKIAGTDPTLTHIQRAIERATEKARANPDNRGRVVDAVSVPATGDKTISHKLGYKPSSVTVRRQISGDPKFTVKTLTSRVAVITGTSAGVADLWVV